MDENTIKILELKKKLICQCFDYYKYEVPKKYGKEGIELNPSISNVAMHLGIEVHTIYGWMKTGRIGKASAKKLIDAGILPKWWTKVNWNKYNKQMKELEKTV